MAEQNDFPIVMRGYAREAVLEAIRDLEREILRLNAQNTQLSSEVREARNQIGDLTQQLGKIAAPNYATVGASAAEILSLAEEQAKRIIADAHNERARQLKALEAETEDIRGEAKGYYDSLVAEAQRRGERLLTGAKVEADEILNQSRAQAAGMIDEATREAAAIRGAISTEVAKMRATAKREIETRRTSFERELAERRMILERELTRELDPELAARLVTEEARINLDLELSARRAEAEQDYLAKHQEAVAATQKYLNEANEQLRTAMLRANTARLEAETLEAAAKSINKRTREEAKAKADAIIVAAEAEARAIIAASHDAAAEKAAKLAEQVANLERERDAIQTYLDNLTSVVSRAQRMTSEA